MKKYIFTFFAVSILAISSFAAKKSEDVSKYRDLVEYRARDGMPNFFKKCQNGADVRVAYLGGSITAQRGWRVQSFNLFKKTFPKAKFFEINAAIGGTGSDFGALRVTPQVIDHKPDLVFIEFAVNDGAGGERSIRNMEGIVRQIWNNNPNCDICFIYTLTCRDTDAMKGGKMKRSANFMEDLADHYKIPSIDFGKAVIDLVNAGKLVMKTDSKPLEHVAGEQLNVSSKVKVDKNGVIPFAKDGVHPYLDTGHVIYTGAIERSLKPLMEASKNANSRKIPKPMFADCPQKVTFVPFEKIKDATKFASKRANMDSPLFKPWKSNTPANCYELEPNDEFTIKVKASFVSMAWLTAIDAGYIEVTIDNEKPREIASFNPYCNPKRLYTTSLMYPRKEIKEHTIKVRVLNKDTIPAKSKMMKVVADNPTNPLYSKNKIYPAAFFIIGEFVE